MKQIAELILKNQTFAVCGHTSPDGDCIGSCVALCRALACLGKQVWLMVGKGDVPRNLTAVWDDSFGAEIANPQVFFALDCGDQTRLLCGAEGIPKAEHTVCIDHHITNTGFADVNHIDPAAAATGELIYLLTEQLGLPVTEHLAMPLYAAIASDTGSFQFSNVTPRTFRVAAALAECGMDFSGMAADLFHTKTLPQLKAQAYAIGHTTLHFDGRVAVMPMPHAYVEQQGLTFEELDFLSGLPRTIDGVLVGVYIKEKSGNEIKISLRSNCDIDMSAIAAKFGGGGHVRAAGVTIKGTLAQAQQQILSAIEEVL